MKAGESSREAISRELYEETGIRAEESEFELLSTERDRIAFYDHYCLKRKMPVQDVVLLPGETDGVQWVSMEQVKRMIEKREICAVIGRQFLQLEPQLVWRQTAQE